MGNVDVLRSRADGTDASVELGPGLDRNIRDDELVWVDLDSPDRELIGRVRDARGLSDASTDALAAEAPAPVARVLEDGVEVVVQGLDPEKTERAIPLRILIGAGWVITSHPGAVPFLAHHRERIQDQREVGRLTPAEFLVSVLGWHLDSFFDAAESLEREVDELDEAALRTDRNIVHRLVAIRQRISAIRRVLSPHREIFAELARPDFLPESAKTVDDEMRALTERVERAREAVGNAREMLIGTFDIHMTRTAQRTNDIMRVLTLASVILLPSVVIAGVMGMNFKVSFFEEPMLFWVVVGAMFALAAGTVAFARSRGWL
jgi:magnesium transporter